MGKIIENLWTTRTDRQSIAIDLCNSIQGLYTEKVEFDIRYTMKFDWVIRFKVPDHSKDEYLECGLAERVIMDED